jgi:pilus assembly protein CpaB
MKRPIVFVILAATGAMLAAMVVFSAINKRESEMQRAMAQTVQIVVAANDIPIGAKIAPSVVKLARWSRDSVPQGAYTDPQAVAGSYAKSDILANEPLVASDLFIGDKTSSVMPLLIPTGMRAMSVEVDEVSDIAGFVSPHSRVDVLVAVAGTGPNEPSFSRIVLQNVEVLAVAQEIEHAKDEPQVVKVVTLLVTPADAEKLTLASREGLLRLAMRNYSDGKIVATSGVDLPALLHSSNTSVGSGLPVMHIQPEPGFAARAAHLATPLRVEVMRDGKSEEAISFINAGTSAHATYQHPEESPPDSVPPAPGPPPPMPDTTESPVSSAKPATSASLAETIENELATPTRAGVSSARTSTNPGAARPGEPGYVPAPKTYVVPQ